MKPVIQSNSTSSLSVKPALVGLRETLLKTLLCEMCLKIGRQYKAGGRFVAEDGQEKPVCPEHFLTLQNAELVAEFRRRKLERIEKND